MKPIILCIMDGWGISNETNHNAIKMGNTPVFDKLLRKYPNGVMQASGAHVGLPSGQMGNSEVGHMNLGAGRIVLQDLPRINNIIENELLADNLALNNLIKEAESSNGKCHLVGLLSDGGVHSHQSHLEAIANYLSGAGIEVYFHAILDGRDTSPQSAKDFVRRFQQNTHGAVPIATLIGRFYAMDRDNRWERIEKAYNLLALGIGSPYKTAEAAILSRYECGETDEFIKACVIESYEGFSHNSDGLFFMNYRADRARELLSALCDPKFSKFDRQKDFTFVSQNGLIQYSDHHKNFMENVLKPEPVKNTLGECLSRANKRQLRLAETEKYPHVTFFFNSGIEQPVLGESRFMVPSPKVATYDLAPKMSADIVTGKLLDSIKDNLFDFILVNYANPDMVGHTGSLDAAIKACEATDLCLGDIYRELKNLGGTLLLTSDHGNCEIMYDTKNKSPHTSHTLNPVPFTVVGVQELSGVRNGSLSDIAPTVLELLKIDVPKEMTGKSLLKF